MKQKAYTLAEVLIAVGIVGILAAVMLPMVNKYKPDTSKFLYLNTYDALAESIRSMASNDAYYVKDDGNFYYEQYPFANLNRYVDNSNLGHVIEGGQNKFCRVLSENLSIIEDADEIQCNDNYTPYDDNNFNPSYTVKNGVEFMITTRATAANLADNHYQTDIIIDINGSDNRPNCVYTAASCRKPDRFTFQVSADADLLPTDRMGISYLETRTNLKYKDVRDYENNTQLQQDIRERLEANSSPVYDNAFELPPSSNRN